VHRPAPLAHAAAVTSEAVLRLTGLTRTHALSRFLVAELTHPHWFSVRAARRDLGFEPPVSFEEGINALSAAVR
jgi:nucleoside-diphosphate-sugar epimerase